MKKELYLYTGIYSFMAQDLMASMAESSDEDITIRINSPGGEVWAGWGIASKIREHEGKVTLKVDGVAASMAAMLLIFADRVEVLDVSNIMIHRAHMYVSSEKDQKFLDEINGLIRKKLEQKLDLEAFKEVTGHDFAEMFTSEEVIDFWLTPKQAKKIGLVDKINKLETAKEAVADNRFYQLVAGLNSPTPPKQEINKNENFNQMTEAEFKEKHPEAYNAMKKNILAAEADRVGAWLKFNHVDPKAVLAGIMSGENLTQTAMADFAVKMNAPDFKSTIEAEAAESLNTEEIKAKAEAKKLAEAKAAKAKADSEVNGDSPLSELEKGLEAEFNLADKK